MYSLINRFSGPMFVLAGSILAAALLLAVAAFAEQPACVGDRHYDGTACCPVVTTTTTTLPDVEPRACPDPPACPTVTCECGDGTTVNNVTVNRCPEFPWYKNCWLKPARNGKPARLICANREHPHRVLIPETDY